MYNVIYAVEIVCHVVSMINMEPSAHVELLMRTQTDRLADRQGGYVSLVAAFSVPIYSTCSRYDGCMPSLCRLLLANNYYLRICVYVTAYHAFDLRMQIWWQIYSFSRLICDILPVCPQVHHYS